MMVDCFYRRYDEIQSNDVLKRHDLIIEAATEMPARVILLRRFYTATSPGRRLNPVPSSNSEGGSQRRGLHFSRQMLSTAVPTKLKLRPGRGSQT